MSKIFIVATPIGNLDDFSKRAIETLKEADFIFCEDTRVSRKLFEKFDIKTNYDSYNSHSTEKKKEKVFSFIKEEKNLAFISDAGTPTISDPGVKIISQIYENFSESEFEIIPIPGPAAFVSALSVSGFSSSEFIFYGFLPHKKGREKIFKEISQNEKTSVFYESPHRLLKALESLEKFCEKNRKIFVARELTKIYEEKKRGNIFEVKNYFLENPEKIRGEFCLVVEGV